MHNGEAGPSCSYGEAGPSCSYAEGPSCPQCWSDDEDLAMARQLQEEDEALARQMQEESDAALAAWCAAQDEQRRAAARPAKPRPAYGDNEFGEPDTPPVQPKPRKQHPVSPLRERNHDSEFGEPGCNSPSTQRRPSAKVAPQGYLSNVQDPALSSEDLKAFVAAAAPVVGAVRNLTTRALSFSRGSDARFHAGPCLPVGAPPS